MESPFISCICWTLSPSQPSIPGLDYRRYLVLSDEGLVITYNKPFEEMIASRFGISENHYLSESVQEEDVAKKTAVYNLMTAIDSWPPKRFHHFLRTGGRRVRRGFV